MLQYNFIRSGQISSREFHLLSIIDSYSGECHLKTSQYAEMMSCSIRTIKRLIKSLVKKGYINIRYGLYKSIHIGLMNLVETVWKPNLNKIKSKVPKWSFKSANGVTTNIERNKEINKVVRYPLFKAEEIKCSYNIPLESKTMLENLKMKLGL